MTRECGPRGAQSSLRGAQRGQRRSYRAKGAVSDACGQTGTNQATGGRKDDPEKEQGRLSTARIRRQEGEPNDPKVWGSLIHETQGEVSGGWEWGVLRVTKSCRALWGGFGHSPEADGFTRRWLCH